MNFWSLNLFLQSINGFRKKKNTQADTWQHQGVPCVMMTSARRQHLLMLVLTCQYWPSQRSRTGQRGPRVSSPTCQPQPKTDVWDPIVSDFVSLTRGPSWPRWHVDPLTWSMLTRSTMTSSQAMMTSAFGGPRADISRTRGTPWCCHVSACVFFFFQKPFINSRNCFKLKKFLINQPELRKLWN